VNAARAGSLPRWAREAAVSLACAGCAVSPGARASDVSLGEALAQRSDAPDLLAGPSSSCASAEPWSDWERYARAFIEADGRVVDRTAGARTTSEGQAYALVFALAADDRARFERILRWTDANLAAGALGDKLPAWLWAEGPHGFAVADANSASDADLWMSYALIEAGRLWREPKYESLGARLLAQVEKSELVELSGVGPALLPAPAGFLFDDGARARLNPSYLPLVLARRFSARDRTGPWSALAQSWEQLLRESARNGLVPDWISWTKAGGFATEPSPERGAHAGPLANGTGSYDAIRAILWASFIDAGDPARAAWLQATRGLADWYRDTGKLPEKVDVRGDVPRDPSDARAAGLSGREGPPGFFAALLPALVARHDDAAAATLRARLDAARNRDGLFGDPPAYYDQNLALFALGFLDGAFRFARDGSLAPRWNLCAQP